MSETRPSFLFVDPTPLLTEARQVSEAAIDLIGVGTAVKDTQIDFLHAAFILPLLL
jgi:hypothetical protein